MPLAAVEFHTGVADPLAFACRLLRKASRAGTRVQVTAPPQTLAALDRALWSFDERDFVPHVRAPGADAVRAAVAARTPIWLVLQACVADPADEGAAPPQVLVNLGAAAPTTPEAFERVIEIVSHEADEAQAGRERWRDYKARGLAVVHHPPGATRA